MQWSWKTTLAAFLAILPQLLRLLFPDTISVELAMLLSTFFASLGLISAKDSNVTGGTVSNEKIIPAGEIGSKENPVVK